MLDDIQNEIHKWGKRNFPNAEPWEAVIGATEEWGEFCHAFLKAHRGIRGKTDAEARDALGDVMIFLLHLAAMRGWSLQTIIEDTWKQVQKRDWIANPNTGRS